MDIVVEKMAENGKIQDEMTNVSNNGKKEHTI